MKKLYKKTMLIYGVGVNDADYPVCRTFYNISGKKKQTKCVFYSVWHHMIERCYDEKVSKKHPTYIGCTVCNEWLTFSNFKRWMEQQDFQGMELDKDLLVAGNKLYSPETCSFIPQKLNAFLTNVNLESFTGVTYVLKSKKFRARCGNFITGKREHLGYFDSQQEAYSAWMNRKCEIAKEFSSQVNDLRVLSALNNLYYRLPLIHSK